MNISLKATQVRSGPSAGMVTLLATACGIIVANIYYAQPLIGIIAPAVGITIGTASVIVSLTQLGYAAGLILLVPLGDLVENRLLVTITIAASIPALLLAACAHSGRKSCPPRHSSASPRSRCKCWCRSPRIWRRTINAARWSGM